MASSDSGEGGSGLADGSVGSIVWVRRRNGSWWPGKILGPEELSATHLMSPRSGTPVKLLGREDASVDWYNLEKSKRVKAFRCGEFSDCIEKAEAVQGLPIKKREKYARREDAILHALELEKEFLEKKDGKISGSTANIQNNTLDSAVKEFVSSSGTPLNGNLRNCNHDLRKVHQNDDSSAEHEGDDSPCAHGANKGAWISSELQNLEIKPQRINLPVYGFRTAPSKVSVAPSAAINDSHSSLIKASTHGHDYPIFAADVRSQSFAEANFRNSMNERDMLLERIPEESTLKGHVKQITLLQQLQSEKIIDHSLQPVDNIVSMTGREDTGNNSRVKRRRTALFSTGSGGFMRNRVGPNIDLEVPISQLGVVNEQPHSGAFVDGTSGSSEDTETDSSDTNCIIPVMNAERAVYSDVFIPTEVHSSALNRLDIMAGHESTSSEESDEFSVDDRSHFHLHDIRCPSGVSRWQLKGKRNVRNLTRRSMDGFAPDPYIHGDGRYFNRSRNHSLRYNENGEKYINEADFIDDGCEPHTERFGDVGYLSKIKAASRQQVGQSSFDWDGLTSGDRFLRGFLGERGDHYYPVYGGRSGHGMLIDVDVQVQAKRQGEHVPWVSLMSRLNGKAIVGHPIQVEKLDDGSTDVLVTARGALGNFRLHNVENSVPQVWRTAQRTSSSRVPRPPGLSRSDDYEAGRYSHAKKTGPESSGSKRGSARKNVSNVARHSHQRMKKPLGKGSLSVSQKTKALSSIGIDQKLGSRLRKLSYDYEMDGVIKPLISGPTTVACIPVKLVFSRLLEAIGRPPSGPVYHGVSVNQQP